MLLRILNGDKRLQDPKIFLRWPQINYLDFLSSDKEPVKARDACCLKVLKKKKHMGPM